MKISVVINGRIIKDYPIFVNQMNVMTHLLDMPIEEREFLFSVGTYERDRNPKEVKKLKVADNEEQYIDMLYIPQSLNDEHIRVSIQSDRVVIERDFILLQKPGVTLYHRFLKKELSCIEVDFWYIKDPLLARFMRLMTIVYIKESNRVEFAARDDLFRHFIVPLSREKAKELLERAIEIVVQNRLILEKILEESSTSQVQYPFCDPMAYFLQDLPKVTIINNQLLIKNAYKVLKKDEEALGCSILFDSNSLKLIEKKTGPGFRSSYLYQHLVTGEHHWFSEEEHSVIQKNQKTLTRPLLKADADNTAKNSQGFPMVRERVKPEENSSLRQLVREESIRIGQPPQQRVMAVELKKVGEKTGFVEYEIFGGTVIFSKK